MTEVLVIQLAKGAMTLIFTISAPILLVGLITGLLISIFQTATSIQDSTLAFVPKMVAIILVIFFMAGWLLNMLVSYTKNLFGDFTPYLK